MRTETIKEAKLADTRADLLAKDAEIERLRAEVEKLRRGEFICQRCLLRKDGESDGEPQF